MDNIFEGIATAMIGGNKIQEVVGMGMMVKKDESNTETETAANQPEKPAKKTSRTNGKLRSPYATKAQKEAGKAINDEKPAEAEIVIVAETKPEPEPEIDFVAALAAAKLEDANRKTREEEERLARIAKIKAEAKEKKEAEKQEKIQAFREAHEAWVNLKKQLQPTLHPYVVNLSNLILAKKRAVEAREDATATVMDKAIAKYKLLWGITAKALGEAISAGFVPEGDEFKKFVEEYKANEARRARNVTPQQTKPVNPPAANAPKKATTPSAPPSNSRPYHTEDRGGNSIADLLKANGQDPDAIQNGNGGKKAIETATEIVMAAEAVADENAATSEIPVNGEK